MDNCLNTFSGFYRIYQISRNFSMYIFSDLFQTQSNDDNSDCSL